MGVWYGVVWVDGLVVFGRCFGWVVGWGSRVVCGRWMHEQCARIVVHISGPNQSAKGRFFGVV